MHHPFARPVVSTRPREHVPAARRVSPTRSTVFPWEHKPCGTVLCVLLSPCQSIADLARRKVRRSRGCWKWVQSHLHRSTRKAMTWGLALTSRFRPRCGRASVAGFCSTQAIGRRLRAGGSSHRASRSCPCRACSAAPAPTVIRTAPPRSSSRTPGSRAPTRTTSGYRAPSSGLSGWPGAAAVRRPPPQ